MFSWSSSTSLKIVGTEGHTPDSLRQEVDRGAKFVIYSYNFSLVVLSFKQPSNIYFVRGGESRVVKGLPFTLISLVFGWWGIPWGIIYTVQSLHQNLSGGKDVTREMIAALSPSSASDSPRAPTAPPPPILPVKPFLTSRRMFGALALLVAALAIGYPAVSLYEAEHLRVALVSGLDAPYEIELNGAKHTLPAHEAVRLTLAEGDFVLRGAPGTPADQTFSARGSFWRRPFETNVLVINPDRAAVVFRETTKYRETHAAIDPDEKTALHLHLNRVSYFLPAPDYFFQAFPKNINLPSRSAVVSKSRIATPTELDRGGLVSLVAGQVTYDVLREFVTTLAGLNLEDEVLQRHIHAHLKPDDARKLFESHLDDRPVLVEWHRSYQWLIEQNFPTEDITTRYRAMMDADPDNGALTYLYARILPDSSRSRSYYEKALKAKHPSPYAAYALGADEFGAGRYAAALELLLQAERSGLRSDALRMRKRDAQYALGRYGEILRELTLEKANKPEDVANFVEELQLSQSQKPDRATGQRAITAFVGALKRRYGEFGDYQAIEDYLGSRLVYALGDEQEFAGIAGKLKGSLNELEAAICRRDIPAATKALANEKKVPARFAWLLMLVAHSRGDTAGADTHFQQALADLATSDLHSRAIARQIAENTAASHEQILHTLNYADELRVMFTALGVRFPDHRAAYFSRARELDHSPAFPHLLLQDSRGDATATKKH
jgi:hypothetical protein